MMQIETIHEAVAVSELLRQQHGVHVRPGALMHQTIDAVAAAHVAPQQRYDFVANANARVRAERDLAGRW